MKFTFLAEIVNNLSFFSDNADDDTWVIAVDMQQALPTPKVTAGVAFYKRKMFVLNVGIHDLKTGRGYMYLWDEITARRGAIEICSCIYKFVTSIVPPTTKNLIIVSDNCPGQNKNYVMVLFYMFLNHSRRFEEITHIFLRPGHTYNAADRDFAVIENHIKGSTIYSIDDHISNIKAAKKNKPFVVTKMQQSDFLDFEHLKIYCTKRGTPQGIRFSDACWFRVNSKYKIGYELATDYFSLNYDGHRIRLAKGIGKKADENFSLKVNMSSRVKYSEPLPLKAAKLKDISYLVYNLVPKYYQDTYWKAILNVPSVEDINNMEDDDDIGGFGDIFDY